MKKSTKLTFLLIAPVLYACQWIVRLVSNMVFQTSASVVPNSNRIAGSDFLPKVPKSQELEKADLPMVEKAEEEGKSLDAVEKAYILRVLKNTEGNRTRTAEILGIGRRTLYRRLSEYGMESGG